MNYDFTNFCDFSGFEFVLKIKRFGNFTEILYCSIVVKSVCYGINTGSRAFFCTMLSDKIIELCKLFCVFVVDKIPKSHDGIT